MGVFLTMPAFGSLAPGLSQQREHRAAARQSMFGVPAEMPTKFVHETTAEERQQKYEAAWEYGGATRVLIGYLDLLASVEANDTLAEFVRNKIRETVKDPAVAKLLCPTDHPLGTKRICVDSHYYSTYNRPNVTLVDVRSAPIEEITSTGLRTAAAHYELDALVFATGFDAMTGSLAARASCSPVPAPCAKGTLSGPNSPLSSRYLA